MEPDKDLSVFHQFLCRVDSSIFPLEARNRPRMVGAAEAAPKASEANQGEIAAVVHKRIIFLVCMDAA